MIITVPSDTAYTNYLTPPWFVATDIANYLEYSEAAAMTRTLDDDEKGLQTVQTPGGEQKVTVINESGLYSAILRSRKPEAREFKRWITAEVLPTIRKHGGYLTEQKIEEALLNPDTLIQLAQNLKNEQEKNRKLETKIENDAPKVNYINRFVAIDDDTSLVRTVAANVGIGERTLYNLLETWGWAYRKRIGQRFSTKKGHLVDEYEWRPYAEHREKFVLRAQHNAPRHHNNQLRQTLYVTPRGAEAIAARIARENGEAA